MQSLGYNLINGETRQPLNSFEDYVSMLYRQGDTEASFTISANLQLKNENTNSHTR